MRFTVPLLCALAAPFCQAAQMPLPELKTTYLECERAARAGALETAAVMHCSTVYEELKQRAFGGDAEALFAWCAAPALLGRVRTLSPALLAEHALVALPTGAGTTRILDDWLAAQSGLPPPRRLSCNHWGAVAGMLVEGAGIGLLPQAWARALQRRGVLRVLVSEPALVPLPYAFQWRRDDARPVVAAMRDLAPAVADFSVAGALF